MKKNSRLYLWVETELKKEIERQAFESKLSINEFCKQKLISNSKLDIIEIKLEKISKMLENRKIYKLDSSRFTDGEKNRLKKHLSH